LYDSDQKIDALIARFEGIAAKMAAGGDSDTFVQLSRDYAELEPVALSRPRSFRRPAMSWKKPSRCSPTPISMRR
jgi:hypothetical protein